MDGGVHPSHGIAVSFFHLSLYLNSLGFLNHHIFRNEAHEAFFEPLFHAKDAPKPDVRQEGFNRPTTTTPIVRDRLIEQRH